MTGEELLTLALVLAALVYGALLWAKKIDGAFQNEKRCRRCGRVLRDPNSALLGIGFNCAKKEAAERPDPNQLNLPISPGDEEFHKMRRSAEEEIERSVGGKLP